MLVHEVMTAPAVTIPVGAPFPRILDLLVHHRIRGLPVVEDDGRLVGMVTEADLLSKAAYGGRHRRPVEVIADLLAGGESTWAVKARALTAGQLMTTDVETIGLREDIRQAARRMLEHGHSRLPVVEGGRVVGIVARSDLLRTLHRTDDELAGDVAAMLADPLRAPDAHEVTATVRNGVVALEGSVLHPMDIPLVEAMVWRLPGVVGVRHDLRARERDPRPVS